MKDKQTFAQFLNVKDFPFVIKDKNGNTIYLENSNGFWSKWECGDEGNEIYYENSDGYWTKREYNDEGKEIYREVSNGFWSKWEYNDEGKEIRYENSNGFWSKWEYNDEGKEIYYENSDGCIIDKRPKPMIELTLEDIAKLKGVSVSQIRIKE